MSVSPTENYTAEELSELIRSLGDADLHRLEQEGRVLALKCWRQPEELLNEAVLRALDGRRHCKKAMGLMPFLFGVMKSVAHEWTKARTRNRGNPDEARWGSPPEIEADSLADDQPSALELLEAGEARVAASEVLKEVTSMFESDEKAWFVIEANMEGSMTPDEVCCTLGIDRREYDAVRKRIRRGFDKVRARFSEARP